MEFVIVEWNDIKSFPIFPNASTVVLSEEVRSEDERQLTYSDDDWDSSSPSTSEQLMENIKILLGNNGSEQREAKKDNTLFPIEEKDNCKKKRSLEVDISSDAKPKKKVCKKRVPNRKRETC